jgi:lipid II isoglutaminyl synthase (glutamine-hydrolysing)
MFPLARALARLLRAVSRRLGRSGGTTAPGRLLLRLSPGALSRMAPRLERGSVLVSATNGKTTTSAMIAAILAETGRPVVHNRAGSNMSWGVATALLDAGREPGQLGLFEVDEAWLPRVADALQPHLYLLANLFRDQLDRYGELELIADRWAELVARDGGRARFVLNADDPLVADLGRGVEGVTYFGVSDDSQALPGLQHAADSKHCRNCGAAYVYEAVYLAHMGRYRCPNCGRERPEPRVAATSVTLEGMSGSSLELETPAGRLRLRLRLPGLYNVYNAVAAAATGLELGASAAQVTTALEGFGGAFGRVETIPVPTRGAPGGGHPAVREVSILLVKNPAGANEVIRTLTLEDGRLDLLLALNDRIADGRDVSWIWDADFELLAGRVRRATCSGTRAEEMALRLKYAGLDAEIEVERDLERSLDAAVASAPGDGGGRLYALPTYTALLELRDLLSRRGLAARWSE